MEEVKTARELGLGEPKFGYEWEAGGTPPGDSAPGRWLVTKRARDWAIIFHSERGAKYVIHAFPPNEEGERSAKSMAIKLVDIAWGKKPESEQVNNSDKNKKENSDQT